MHQSLIKSKLCFVNKTEETMKMTEKAKRYLNITFINELVLIFDRLGVDTTRSVVGCWHQEEFFPFSVWAGWRILMGSLPLK